MPIITLTTDFGTSDGYVGAMKGVLAARAPAATVVDIAHDVPRQDVAHAAWTLASAAFEFPTGTIHVAVVDPGVGGHRAEVIVLARGHLYDPYWTRHAAYEQGYDLPWPDQYVSVRGFTPRLR